MGAVYRAKHISLDRIVAIKIIMPQAAAIPSFAERFAREAKALAKLSHPNIVAIFDFGQAMPTSSQPVALQPLYYLVMEYVDGINLRQLMAKRSLKPSQTLSIIVQICEALQYAHHAGVIHRDIKPENLLIAPSPNASSVQSSESVMVKIVDFGLAKLVENDNASNLTLTHQVIGTARYMAPEQMDGAAVDHRVDIYSLGVVFYEMLTGHLPVGSFERPSQTADVDNRIDEVVMRTLAREPSRRYQHASAIKSAVDVIRGQPKTPDIPTAIHSKSLVWAILVGNFASLGLIMIAYGFTESNWVSLVLLLPCVCLAFCISRFRDSMSLRGMATCITIFILWATVLISVIATRSDWAVSNKIIACIWLGMLLLLFGTIGTLVGYELRRLSRLTVAEKEERSRKTKEQKTRSGISEVAFIVGALGFFRTLSLFSAEAGEDKAYSVWTNWFSISGPIIVVSAICMHNTRFLAFCVAGCLLCFVTGNPIAILIGIAGLVTLLKSDVSVLFDRKPQSPTTDVLHPTTTPLEATRIYTPTNTQHSYPPWAAIRNTAKNWIQSWSGSRLQIVQSSLLLIHIACMFFFFSFSFQNKVVDKDREFLFTLGSPTPWFNIKSFENWSNVEVEKVGGLSTTLAKSFERKSGLNWSYQFSNFFCWVLLIAIASALLNWRIDLARNPVASSRYRPTSILKAWALLFFAIILAAMLILLFSRFNK